MVARLRVFETSVGNQPPKKQEHHMKTAIGLLDSINIQPATAEPLGVLVFNDYVSIGGAFIVIFVIIVPFYFIVLKAFEFWNHMAEKDLLSRAAMTLARVRDALKAIDDLCITGSWGEYRIKFNTSQAILAKYLTSGLISGPSGIYPIYALSYEATEASVAERVAKENGFDLLDGTDVSDWLKLVIQTFLKNSRLEMTPSDQPDFFDGSSNGPPDPYLSAYQGVVKSVKSLVDGCPESLLVYEKCL
jgi:hypothetical protein